jgi:hypothetical protein
MQPSDLKANHFSSYPTEARQLAVNNLILFRRLPEIMLSILLQEVIEYDWKFPAERKELERQLAYLNSLALDALESLVAGFARLRLSPSLEKDDWVKSPGEFVERLTADLWSTHQMESFRVVADQYQSSVDSAVTRDLPVVRRLGIVVVGLGVRDYNDLLFQKLRPHGVYFNNVKPEGGLNLLIDRLAKRAVDHPIPFAHWYVAGGEAFQMTTPGITSISYGALEVPRKALLGKMQTAINSGGGGPEALRTFLAQMRPEDLGFSNSPSDAVLNHFQVALLTEGSGTQIFSTTFAQWAAREVLRRAQPLTLLVRFAPRQRQRSINELLSAKLTAPETDPLGSLIDADMGAYYTWLNQQRLTGAEEASFLVWFEGHPQALAIGVSMPHGTESSTSIDLNAILGLIT